jgi:Vacuole effluxer Atg22 like
MTIFQSLATAAGYDAALGPGNPCTAATSSSACLLPWGRGTKSVSSVVLVANGVSFAVMTALFTTIGSAADYGTFGRWLLLVVTVVCWGAQFASMSLTCERRIYCISSSLFCC